MPPRHRVAALVVNEVVAFDLATPAQVFGGEPDLYEWAVCAPEPGPVPAETGFDVLVPHGLDALASADTIIVPGIGDRAWPLPPEPLDALRAASERGARVASICEWMQERLGEPLTVEAMARHASCSARSFARRFRAETGTTPLQWLIGRRVAEAQRLLEGTDLPVEQVAARSGFGTAAALRQHFGRAVATSPSAYRRAFRPHPEPA